MYNNILRLVLSVIIFLGFFSITYQVFFYFKKDNQLNFNYVLDNINDSQAANAILSLDNGRDVTVTNDLTPRIAFWPGKANQHINQQGYWISDYDDAGGHPSTFFSNDYGDRPLEYCKKWYPQTLSVRPYKVETIETWRRAKYYEQSNYTRVVTSIECVQSNNNDSDLIIQNPPTISLSASPNPVQYGNIVDLNWNVTNATSCTGSNGWTGNKNANGGAQSIANMTANTTFILTCTGPGGTVSNSVYVPVNQPVIQNPPTNNSNTVISPVSNTQTSCPVFTKYLKKGDPNNDRNEVKLWQAFLNKYEGFNLVLDGVYGGQTEIAIRAFQTKYKQFVLIPWGITEATGYTYKTTRAYANFLLGCPEGGIYLDNGVYINFR